MYFYPLYIKNSRPKPDFLHYNHNPKPSHCCFFIRARILGCKRRRTKLQISKRWSSFFAIFRHFPGARSSVRKCPSDLLGVMRFFVALDQ